MEKLGNIQKNKDQLEELNRKQRALLAEKIKENVIKSNMNCFLYDDDGRLLPIVSNIPRKSIADLSDYDSFSYQEFFVTNFFGKPDDVTEELSYEDVDEEGNAHVRYHKSFDDYSLNEDIHIKIAKRAIKHAWNRMAATHNLGANVSNVLGIHDESNILTSGLYAVMAPPAGGKTLYLNSIHDNAASLGLSTAFLSLGEPDDYAFVTIKEIEFALSITLSNTDTNVIFLDSLRFCSYIGSQKLLPGGISRNVFEVCTALDVVAKRLGVIIIATVTVENADYSDVYYERLRGACSGVIEIDLGSSSLIYSLRTGDRSIKIFSLDTFQEKWSNQGVRTRINKYTDVKTDNANNVAGFTIVNVNTEEKSDFIKEIEAIKQIIGE